MTSPYKEKSLTLFIRFQVGDLYDFGTDHTDRMMSQIIESPEFKAIVVELLKESRDD